MPLACVTGQYLVQSACDLRSNLRLHTEKRGANPLIFYVTDSFIARSCNLWLLGSNSVNDYRLDNQKPNGRSCSVILPFANFFDQYRSRICEPQRRCKLSQKIRTFQEMGLDEKM